MLVYNDLSLFSKFNPKTLGLEVFGPLFWAELEKVFGDPSTDAAMLTNKSDSPP